MITRVSARRKEGASRIRRSLRWGTLAPVFVLALLAGCASAPVPQMEDASHGVIVGRIEAPTRVTEVYLHQVGRPNLGGFNAPRATIQRSGTFIFVNLPPGRYYLAGFDDGLAPYWIPYDKDALERVTIRLGAGGLEYAGSFRVANVQDSPWFGAGSFDLENLRQPDERAILLELRPIIEGTGWENRVDERLKALR